MTLTTSHPTTHGQRIRTGIAGEFFVAGELTRRGWIATLTSKNTPGVDILASRPADEDPTGKTQARIDVKTRTEAGRGAWWLGGELRLTGRHDFYVLVDIGDEDGHERPRYWIIPAQVANQRKVYNGSQIRSRDVKEYEGRWELLGGAPARRRQLAGM